MRRRAAFLLLLALLLSVAGGARAWPPAGLKLERAELPGLNGFIGLGADAAGGTFVAWSERDTTGALAFRVHHLDVNGNPYSGWTAAGVRVLAPVLTPWAPLLTADGAGGTYLTWSELDSVTYVGHLAADGSLVAGWPARGVKLATLGKQRYVVATDDGAGGVLLAWSRILNGATGEIVTQRFLADGTRAPGFAAAGRPLTSFDYQMGRFHPQLVRDADRGFWVSFHTVGLGDSLFGASAYAVLHLEPNGLLTSGQPANGSSLSLPNIEVGTLGPFVPVPLAPDGLGGVFAFTLGNNGNVRAFHVLSPVAEDPAWPVGGVILAGGADWPTMHFLDGEENYPVAAGDLAGGAWVGWRDQADFLVHASRVLINGSVAPGWANPSPIAGTFRIGMSGDPAGLYVASLVPISCPHFDCTGPLTLVRMDTSGALAPGWPAAVPPYDPTPGIAFGSGGPQDGPCLVNDGDGGVVVAWIQYPEYYVMRFTVAGELAGVPPTGAGGIGVHSRFDPSAGVRVSYSLGEPRAARVELFDILGRRLASAPVSAASGEITLPGTRALGSGVYLVRLTVGVRSVVSKLVAFH